MPCYLKLRRQFVDQFVFKITRIKYILLVCLTLSLPRSSTDDLVFSVFTSNFFKFSYKINLLKNQFVTLFFIRFS